MINRLEPAVLTKSEVMRYLKIGEERFKKLLINPSFPKQKPIIEKWSKVEVDRWLNNLQDVQKEENQQNWQDFI